MTRRPPVKDAPDRLRQRLRKDGTWRIWWEPRAAEKAMGFEVVDYDPRAPLQAVRGARQLNDAVAKARAGIAQPARRQSRLITDLIDDYTASLAFERLRPKTQESYRKVMSLIRTKWGDVAVAAFDKPTMHTWYEALYRTGHHSQAAALVRMMSILMSHAEKRGWRDENTNPCRKLGIDVPDPRKRSALWEEFDAIIWAAGECNLPDIGLAAAISMLQGQRQTDVLAARLDQFRQIVVTPPGEKKARPTWVYALTRSKAGNDGAMMLHPELVPMIAARLAGRNDMDAPLIVDPSTGRPYSESLFNKRWRAVRDKAASRAPSVGSLQFRDLRRTFGINARAGGASREDTADILGNSAATDDRLNDTYMPPSFFTASRAVQAVARPKSTDDQRKKA